MANDYLSQIKQCVTFIFAKNDKGEFVPNGTGFFVGVKNENDPNAYNLYLVTAKHVLLDQNNEFLPLIEIRLNQKNKDATRIRVSLKDLDILTHEDKDVDLAAFACVPDQNIFDFKFIAEDLIANKSVMEKQEIAEGDEVFFSGLFTSHVGQKRNQPIIRFGRVSLISDEKIEWPDKVGAPPKLLELYLMECQSFGGNSGSPVFFQLNPLRKPGQLRMGGSVIFLAGVMMGSFLSGSKIQVIETKQNLVSLQNIGIAAIIPAYKLHEILFSEKLINSRKNSVPKPAE